MRPLNNARLANLTTLLALIVVLALSPASVLAQSVSVIDSPTAQTYTDPDNGNVFVVDPETKSFLLTIAATGDEYGGTDPGMVVTRQRITMRYRTDNLSFFLYGNVDLVRNSARATVFDRRTSRVFYRRFYQPPSPRTEDGSTKIFTFVDENDDQNTLVLEPGRRTFRLTFGDTDDSFEAVDRGMHATPYKVIIRYQDPAGDYSLYVSADLLRSSARAILTDYRFDEPEVRELFQPPKPKVGGTTFGRTKSIVVDNWAFTPARAILPVNTTIRWTNRSSHPHVITSVDGAWEPQRLATGESFEFVIRRYGTIGYYCSLHERPGRLDDEDTEIPPESAFVRGQILVR